MKNLKATILGYLSILITFILFSAIAFALPVNRDNTFWILYSFTSIAIIVQTYIWNISFKNSTSLKSKFFGLPIANVGGIYLILQLIVFARLISIPNFPDWLSFIICAFLFGITLLIVIGAEAARSEILRVEEKVNNKISFIKNLQLELNLLISKEEDSEIKAALQNLEEAIKFSDPMSDENCLKIEEEIKLKIKSLSDAFENKERKLLMINEIDNLIKERNLKTKLNK